MKEFLMGFFSKIKKIVKSGKPSKEVKETEKIYRELSKLFSKK